jgi:mono/diheme cytochrome c family protein
MKRLSLVLLLPVAALAGCDRRSAPPAGTAVAPAPAESPVAGGSRGHDFATVMRGGKLFQENCAQCHGELAQGAPQWQKPDASGKYPAPPLDGSGHAWHHPKDALIKTIRDGTVQLGGSMPPWKEKLSDQDIEAIIAWFQARWPEEIYRSWLRMEEQARAQRTAR